MKRQKLYLVGTHRYAFQAGKPAEVIGVEMVTPNGESVPRACFHLRFEDGREDWTPVFADPMNPTTKSPDYELISEEQLQRGEISEVVY